MLSVSSTDLLKRSTSAGCAVWSAGLASLSVERPRGYRARQRPTPPHRCAVPIAPFPPFSVDFQLERWSRWAPARAPPISARNCPAHYRYLPTLASDRHFFNPWSFAVDHPRRRTVSGVRQTASHVRLLSQRHPYGRREQETTYYGLRCSKGRQERQSRCDKFFS